MLASGVVLGLAAGWLLGGRPGRIADLHVAWWPVLLIAIVVRAVAPALGESFLAWVLSFAVIVAVALANLRLPGMALIAVGSALNLVVVLMNAAMPVDAAAAAIAATPIPADGLHREMRATDVLTLFADRIPVPPIGRVYSVGDIVLALGGFWVAFAAIRRQ